MSARTLFRLATRPSFTSVSRRYASKAANTGSKTAAAEAKSSCPPDTVLTGVNYLKGQEPVRALPDDQYPEWLWGLLKPKVHAETGPGSKAEKARMRKENRQRIRDTNFMKTQ